MSPAPAPAPLALGHEVVRLLIPHRPPFLFVDGVTHLERSPRLSLRAFHHVREGDPVLQGHFPGLPVWPGVLTVEGLGQSCHVAWVVDALCETLAAAGIPEPAVLEALREADRGLRATPGFTPPIPASLREALARPGWNLGFSAGVEMRFLEPVFPGARLEYRTTRTHFMGGVARFEVAAEVAGRTVARGALTSVKRLAGGRMPP